jgi:hypothetical protein
MSGKSIESSMDCELGEVENLKVLGGVIADKKLGEISAIVSKLNSAEKTRNFEKFTVNTKDLKGTPFL